MFQEPLDRGHVSFIGFEVPPCHGPRDIPATGRTGDFFEERLFTDNVEPALRIEPEPQPLIGCFCLNDADRRTIVPFLFKN